MSEVEQLAAALANLESPPSVALEDEPLARDVRYGQEAAQGGGPGVRPLDNPDAQNLGRPIVVLPGTPGLVLNIRGDDSESQMMTVTMILTAPPYPDGDKTARVVPPDATARITWGQGGVNTTARVDLRDGMQLSVCASTLRVEIDLAGPAGTEPLGVSAFVAYGLRPSPSNKRPVLTVEAVIPNGGAVTIPIPEFAYDVEVYSDTIGATLTLIQDTAGPLVRAVKTAADNSVRMVLVRRAFFIEIANTGAVPVNVSALFGIDL